MKKIIIGSIIFIVSGGIAFAQTTNNPVQLFEPIKSIFPKKPVEGMEREQKEVRNEVKNVREETKREMNAARVEVRTQNEKVREEIKQQTEEARKAFEAERATILKTVSEGPQEAMKLLQERRQEFQKKVEAKREELKNTIQEKRIEAEKVITTKREELKKKLGQFKDEQKKRVTEQVNENLNKVNQNVVNRFTNNINELERVLTNINTRADKATANGSDVSSVLAAVQIAKDAIAPARIAISTQAGKVYSVTISTEAKVADDLKISRDTLNTDLKTVQEKVRTAHTAVLAALMELQKIPNINKPVSSVNTTSTDKESQGSTTVTQ